MFSTYVATLHLEAIGPFVYSICCDVSRAGEKFNFSCGVLVCAHLLSGLFAESRESRLRCGFSRLLVSVGFDAFGSIMTKVAGLASREGETLDAARGRVLEVLEDSNVELLLRMRNYDSVAVEWSRR